MMARGDVLAKPGKKFAVNGLPVGARETQHYDLEREFLFS